MARRWITGNSRWDSAPTLALTPATTFPVQLLQGVAASGGTATATILSLGSRLYAATET
jgi:hypothetical protein